MLLCAICSSGEVILWIGGVWFCGECAWKNELFSGSEEEALFDAEVAVGDENG